MPVKHRFVSGVTDGADPTVVQPGDWNEYHAAPYASGSFTIETGNGAVHVDDLILSGSETVTLEGTSTLRII